MSDVTRTREHVVHAVEAASDFAEPFYHLRLTDVFPADVYAALLESMPAREDYYAMSGRARKARGTDGTRARTKIDLFPETLRRLPARKKAVWMMAAEVLRSREIRDAFVRRMAPGLERRFGPGYASVGLYPFPILTRDIPGYKLRVHADTPWKGITIQIYMPPDASYSHVGTVFNKRAEGNGGFEVAARMSFMPNSGYAFVVVPESHHSVELVGPEVPTRDSIQLAYFVDQTFFQVAKNRSKRLGQLVRGMVWPPTGG